MANLNFEGRVERSIPESWRFGMRTWEKDGLDALYGAPKGLLATVSNPLLREFMR